LTQNIQAAIKNVEEYLSSKGEKLGAKAQTPLSNGYTLRLDMHHSHSLIGVLWWVAELGCVNICIEILMMSSHLALSHALHIFAYLQYLDGV
jgi:hypothetical protein